MRRRLFAVASAISLLLCLATVGLWVRSYYVFENWTLTAGRRYILQSCLGELSFSVQQQIVAWVDGLPDNYEVFAPYAARTGHPEPFAASWHLSHQRDLEQMWVYPRTRAGFCCGKQPESFNTEVLERDAPSGFPTCIFKVPVSRFLVVPYWFLFAVTAPLPIIKAGRWGVGAWRRRSLRGFCPHCSYSLTGNTSGVCPECGTPVAGKAGVKA
jgi:hypothetical protein